VNIAIGMMRAVDPAPQSFWSIHAGAIAPAGLRRSGYGLFRATPSGSRGTTARRPIELSVCI
jgi:hypothetical protein